MGKGWNRHINLIGEINDEMYASFVQQFRELEAENNQPIGIHLSSDGGFADVALAICSVIRQSLCKVIINVHGRAESAAVLILAYGDVRNMASEAWVMVHEEQLKESGSVTEREKAAAHGRRKEDQWNKLLAVHTKANEKTWQKLHQNTTYLNAGECLALGLIDKII